MKSTRNKTSKNFDGVDCETMKENSKVQSDEAWQKWSNVHFNGFASGSVIVIVMDSSKLQLVSSATKSVVKAHE